MPKFIFFIAVFLFISACKKDDAGDFVTIPPRSLTEVAAEDATEIQEFLNTHFYNYEEFETPPVDFDFKIRIDTIAGANADKRPLSQDVQPITISVSSGDLLLSQDETADHTMYYLEAREGSGTNPTVADSVYVRYKGTLLDGTEFDGSFNIPTWFDLGAIQGPGQGARGFSEGIPKFKSGGNVIENPDGTFTVENYGVGLIIMPSGLGFFNSAQGIIPAYSPLVFTLDLFTLNETDHDGDGIPSILEDVDGDGYLYNDNTDEQQERDANTLRVVDFLDADDDNDGTPTRDEIEIDDEGNITFPDTDGDGTPDYRDRDNS